MNCTLFALRFFGFILVLLPNTLAAQQDLLQLPSRPATAPTDDGELQRQLWDLSVSVESEYIFGSEIDGASDSVDVWSNQVRLRYGGAGWKGSRLNFQLSYENRQYDFNGRNTFFPGANAPWDSVNTIGLGMTVFQVFNDSWGGLLQANLRAAAESGADLTDGLSGLVLVGVGHQFSRSFRLGLGLTTIFRFENSPIFLPGLVVDWQIDEAWRFQLLGPQGELSYRPNEEWQFGIGVGLDGRRFRLDDDQADAIAQEFRVPAFFRVSWSPSNQTTLRLKFGVDLYRQFNISDRNGDNSRSFGADPGFFLGLSVVHRF